VERAPARPARGHPGRLKRLMCATAHPRRHETSAVGKTHDQTSIDTAGLAAELFAALNRRRPVALLSTRRPGMTIDDAYAVSLGVLERRLARAERIVGKKIGLTAKVVQDALGIKEPDFGFPTDAMATDDGAEIRAAECLMTPMIEAEMAFVLKASLIGPGVTPEQVLEGVGAAVMGAAQNAMRWLADRLGEYGVTLDAGDVVLPGSLVPLAPARPGERHEARFAEFGTVSVAFS
jgi:2-keto-4-pentenoate hydratase